MRSITASAFKLCCTAALIFSKSYEHGNDHDVIEEGPSRLLFVGQAAIGLYVKYRPNGRRGEDFDISYTNESEEAFSSIGEKKGVDAINPDGPSVTTARTYAKLGGEAAYIGILGDDDLATRFEKAITADGVEDKTIRRDGETTTELHSLVTPDGERQTYKVFGAGGSISEEDIHVSVMNNFDYYVVSTNMLRSPGKLALTTKMVDATLNSGKQIITLLPTSDFEVRYKDALLNIVDKSAYVCGTKEEFARLYGINNISGLKLYFLKATSGDHPIHKAVIMMTEEFGTFLFYGGRFQYILPSTVLAVDTAGADDVFGGALLYGILNGYTVQQASKLAHAAVSDILTRIGITFSEELSTRFDEIKRLPSKKLEEEMQEKAWEDMTRSMGTPQLDTYESE
ncbi:Probable fructokinase [Babesia bigemina]|uniref:Probable fructokinase n=1 Tax=Babesia bigemina TaxID=5866 RepID=A0A061D411_BABBI|nr:Probable fructokinase [Babesia bigemina]CDR93714.1 Probable fructokinase [Babesia bigemina]|eukprot:XP_012765900.1 Probable fructokinase [Babesia bigemina]